jgi:hypothetical protein
MITERKPVDSIQQLAAQADAALKQVSTADVGAVSGGTTADCPATVTLNAGVVTVTDQATTLAGAVIDVYEGIVESTSYIIERVLGPYDSAP